MKIVLLVLLSLSPQARGQDNSAGRNELVGPQYLNELHQTIKAAKHFLPARPSGIKWIPDDGTYEDGGFVEHSRDPRWLFLRNRSLITIHYTGNSFENLLYIMHELHHKQHHSEGCTLFDPFCSFLFILEEGYTHAQTYSSMQGLIQHLRRTNPPQHDFLCHELDKLLQGFPLADRQCDIEIKNLFYQHPYDPFWRLTEFIQSMDPSRETVIAFLFKKKQEPLRLSFRGREHLDSFEALITRIDPRRDTLYFRYFEPFLESEIKLQTRDEATHSDVIYALPIPEIKRKLHRTLDPPSEPKYYLFSIYWDHEVRPRADELWSRWIKGLQSCQEQPQCIAEQQKAIMSDFEKLVDEVAADASRAAPSLPPVESYNLIF